MQSQINIIGVEGIPEILPTSNLTELIIRASQKQGVGIQQGDILVITHKIVSKAESRLLDLKRIPTSEFALRLGRYMKRDPRLIEVVLNEAKRIVKMGRNVIITENRQGFVCANAGVDRSNVPGNDNVLLLPINPDRSAQRIKDEIKKKTGVEIGVIISDTFGRPWREGLIDVAIGVAGLNPVMDYRTMKDHYGHKLRVTVMAIADELASAAELVMGKISNVPVAIVRGYPYPRGNRSAKVLVRRRSRDLFR